ncbi:hypothetical protein F5X68DRAFT_276156 [Plectosphaerella plurivora]|uniref:Uncharacterized protein n=1 Tax=Plectosphaerella plurivora TaxID=936078 RepID=A0A9P8VAQ6_9PEZI|nr:hypothetical protein F5X68DRAFT_276156 [Plectosphaerella plurivora]
MKPRYYILFAVVAFFFLHHAFRVVAWLYWDLMGTLYNLNQSLSGIDSHRFGQQMGHAATECFEVWDECVRKVPGFYRPDSIEHKAWTHGCEAMRSLCSAAKGSVAGHYM